MKILVLTSRYTATRDIIGEDFGRQTRLFEALKKFRHDIEFFCSDYRKFENKDVTLHGIRVFIRPFSLLYFFKFVRELNSALKRKKYDLLIATSDPIWGLFGYYYAKKYNIRFLYDLHDNYETYMTYSIPFFSFLDKWVIKNADIVTTVSSSLKRKISKIRVQNVFVVENGVNIGLFNPKNKPQSRKKLRLPLDAKIIAYAGTLQKMQGIHLLIKAFEALKKDFDNLRLVLAGRVRQVRGESLSLGKEGIVWLKELEQKGVAELINAADVAVVPSTTNEFTKYCFPYKVIEYMACNAKIVATDVGDMSNLLPKSCICRPDSVNALAEKLRSKLNSKEKVNYRNIAKKYTWENIAKKLDRVIRKEI